MTSTTIRENSFTHDGLATVTVEGPDARFIALPRHNRADDERQRSLREEATAALGHAAGDPLLYVAEWSCE